MRQTRITRVAMLLSILMALALTGCHRDERAAASVAAQFMDGLKSGDRDAIKATLTQAAQEKWSALSTSYTPQKNSIQDDYRLGEVVITDDTALVPVTVKDTQGNEQNLKVKLRREENEWRVFALILPAGTTEVTLDFEHPELIPPELMRALGQNFGEMFKAMGEGLGAMLKGFGEGMSQAFKGLDQGLKSGGKP